MALSYSVPLRNTMIQNVQTDLDAQSTPGVLNIYSGTRPATGGALSGNTLLATVTFSKPSAPAASNGVLTFNAIAADNSAAATGTATWARATDGAGNFVFDANVGTSGSDINLNSTSITAGGIVSITSATITEGNP